MKTNDIVVLLYLYDVYICFTIQNHCMNLYKVQCTNMTVFILFKQSLLLIFLLSIHLLRVFLYHLPTFKHAIFLKKTFSCEHLTIRLYDFTLFNQKLKKII